MLERNPSPVTFDDEITALYERRTNAIVTEDEISTYDGVLYHYTTSTGLLGILETQIIWGTEVSYINDAQEIKYGIDLVVNQFGSYAKGKDDLVQEIATRTLSILTQQQSIFVACFCEDGDLLSQWRGYSGFGLGYSIGLNPVELAKNKRKDPFRYIDIRRVIYDKDDQISIVNSELDFILDASGKLLENHTEERRRIINHAAGLLAAFLNDQIVRFKSDAFQEEREWRAIYVNSDRNIGGKQPVKFRTDGGQIVPYMELDLGPSARKETWALPITEIIAGPQIDYHKAGKSIELIYGEFDAAMPEVRGSSIALQ